MEEIKFKDLSDIKVIYHISDIHIYTNQRHDEYHEVFENLCKYLQSEDINNDSILVITGNLVHNYRSTSYDLFSLSRDFIYNISKILPVIYIAGNNDCVNDEEVLSSIFCEMDLYHSMKYLKDSGLYKINNINFCLWSVIDKKRIKSDEMEDGIKVLLYNGYVENVKGYNGYELRDFGGEKVNLSNLEGFNYVMLGGVNRHQFLGNNIGYSGTLIQQNHEEDLRGHGLIRWDLVSGEGDLVEIKNRYGYKTIRVENGVIGGDLSDIPNIVRLRVRYKDTTRQELMEIEDIIKEVAKVELINNQEMMSTVSISDELGLKEGESLDNMQKRLILEEINNLGDNNKKKLLKINEKYSNKEVIEDIRVTEWRVNYMEFKNLFCYGRENIVDFRKLGGIVGVVGRNGTGKTSLIDILTLCIYGECSKGSFTTNARELVNKREKSYGCLVSIQIGSDEYLVERWGEIKSTGKMENSASFRIYNRNGSTVLGRKSKDVNEVVKKYFGSYDEIKRTHISLQNNFSGMMNETNAKINDYLMEMLGIAELNNNYNMMRKEYLRMVRNVNQIKKKVDVLERAQSVYMIKKLENEKLLYEKNIKYLGIIINKLGNDGGMVYDIEKIRNEMENMVYFMSNLKVKRKEYDEMMIKWYKMKGEIIEIEDINEVEIYKEIEILEEKLSLMGEGWLRYKELKGKLEYVVKDSQRYKYDDGCENCKNNKIKREEGGKELKMIKKEYEKMAKSGGGIYDYGNIENKLEELKNKYDIYKRNEGLYKELGIIEGDIEELREEIDEMEGIEMEYKRMKYLVSKGGNEVIGLRNIESDYEKKVIEIEGELKYRRKVLLDMDKQVDEVNKSVEELAVYKMYLGIIKRVILRVMSKVLPILSRKMGQVLEKVTNTKLEIEIVEKESRDSKEFPNFQYELKVDDIKGRRYVKALSGGESFIYSVALRMALISMNQKGRAEFLVVDEGWGNLDETNFAHIPDIYGILRENFRYVLLMSHIEEFKSNVDMVVKIDVGEDGYSRLEI